MSTRPNVLAWAELARTVGTETGLDPAVILAVVERESQGSTMATNATSGAAGLMQVIGKHHEKLIQTVAQERNTAYRLSDWALLLHPEIGLRVGARHLAWCVKDCGSIARGLAKYHTGACDAGAKTDSIGTPTKAYVADIMALIPAYRDALSKGTGAMAPYNFDPIRVEWPDNMIDLTIQKQAGWGWSWCEDRPPILMATVEHETQGVPVPGGDSIAWYHQFFGPKGERARDALVDAIVDRDGRAAWLNNPYGAGRFREPWASGGGNGYEGDGVAFIRKYGATQNKRGLSTEIITKNGQRITEYQVETMARIMSVVHHWNKCPWDRFPFNPVYGMVTDFGHYELSSSSCRLEDADVQLYQNRCRALLKAAQTGESEDLTPPPTPITNPANKLFPEGWTEKVAAQRFGELERINPNGSRDTFRFDPKGPISNLWLQRGWAEGGQWGEAQRWLVLRDGETTRDLIFFGDGSVLTRSGNHQWSWSGDLEAKPEIKVA